MQVLYCDVCGVKLPDLDLTGSVDVALCKKCAAARGVPATSASQLTTGSRAIDGRSTPSDSLPRQSPSIQTGFPDAGSLRRKSSTRLRAMTPEGHVQKPQEGGSSASSTVLGKIPEPMPAIQAGSAPAGTMGFYFCEKCGKRVTAADLARGQGRDKQLKGVYCAACSDGTMTVAFDAVSQAEIWKEEQARRQGQRRSTSTRLSGSRADNAAPRRGHSRLSPTGSRTAHSGAVWVVLAVLLFCGVGLFLAFGGGSQRPEPSASNLSADTTRQPVAESPDQRPSSEPASAPETTREEELPPPAGKPSTSLEAQVEPAQQPAEGPVAETAEPTAPVTQVPSSIPDTQTPETTKTVPGAAPKPETITVNEAISPAKVKLSAEVDAYVRGGDNASKNFGRKATLDTKDGADPNYDRKIYIRFDLSTLPASITSAKLRIYAVNAHRCTRGVKLVADDTWQETAITWNNAPAPTGSVLSTWQPVAGQFAQLDLTSTVQQELAGDKKVSLLIYATSADGRSGGADFASREAGDTDQRPVLIINK